MRWHLGALSVLLFCVGSPGALLQANEPDWDIGDAYMLSRGVPAPVNLVQNTLILVRPSGASDYEILSFSYKHENNRAERHFSNRIIVPRSSIELSLHRSLPLTVQGNYASFSHPYRTRTDHISLSTIPVEYCVPLQGGQPENNDVEDVLNEIENAIVEQTAERSVEREPADLRDAEPEAPEGAEVSSDDRLKELAQRKQELERLYSEAQAHAAQILEEIRRVEAEERRLRQSRPESISNQLYENLQAFQAVTEAVAKENHNLNTEAGKKAAFRSVLSKLKNDPKFQGRRGSQFFEVLNLWLETRQHFSGSNVQPQEAFWVQHNMEILLRDREGEAFAPEYGDFGDWLVDTPAIAALDPSMYSGWNPDRNDIRRVLNFHDVVKPNGSSGQTPDSQAFHRIVSFHDDYRSGIYQVSRPYFTNFYHPASMNPPGSKPLWADNPRMIERARAQYKRAKARGDKNAERFNGYMRWIPVQLPDIENRETGEVFSVDHNSIVTGYSRWTSPLPPERNN